MHRPNPCPPRQHAVNTVAVSLALAGGFLFNHALVSHAAEGNIPALAQREVQRREALIIEQQTRLPEAENLLKDGKTEPALKIFEETFTSLPDVPLAQETRTLALEGYIRAGLSRAKELTDAGDYPAAQALLDKLDSSGVAKGDRRIVRLRQKLTDPDRYPPALTPQHVKRVAEVTRLLTLAGSQRETGQYDKALVTYEEVIRLDPTNTAARRGLELTEEDRTRYLETARDHSRSKMLNEVNAAWEKPVSPNSGDISGLFGSGAGLADTPNAVRGSRETIQQKLRSIRIAQIDFSGAALEEVMEYLRVRSRDLDPTGRGVDFVVSLPPDQSMPLISLNLRDVPIEEVLRYVTEIASITYRVEDYAVRLVPTSENTGVLISKSYRVPPDFITSAPVAGDPAASADPFANTSKTATSGILVRRLGAKEFLETFGVTFNEGAGANYNPTSNMLIVRNTASNLEIVDRLVEQTQNRSPKQVVIDVRLLEIGDNRLKEIGFDWLLAPFGVANNSTQFAGGTTGNAQDASTYLSTDFPTQVASGAGTTALGFNPITAGLRSSGNLDKPGVDSVLFGAVDSVSKRSPGVLSLSGVLTDPQFQGVLRALDQKKGVDLASQPSIVTRSGQKATLEVTRELLYPTEFDPPQIPTNFGNSNLVDAVTGEPIVQPRPPVVVTPTTPTAFESRKTGVVLDVEPVISDDGRSVDLTVTPQFTEFAGFVNYGSPIRTIFEGTFVELTDNRIFQPVFDSKKVVTSVKIWDGATVVLGGLVSDQDQIIQDKVPILGDAPFVGRLFKSDVKQRRIRQLVFFVTVRVVDPSGARINQP